MGEKTTTGKADRPKRPIEILRDRLGGVSKELQASVKEQGRIRKLLRGALAGGPRTVPELGAECDRWRFSRHGQPGRPAHAG